MANVSKRLYANVKRNGKCLEWTGCKDRGGYGRMSVHNRPILVHRLAWELSNGPVPEGMCVCHRCDNPSCIRIDHLFLGTHDDNMQDCIQKGRDHKRGLKGEEHNLSKLTDADVMAIRVSDEPGKDLAAKYDVTQTTISDVQKGRIWQHLPVDEKHISPKHCKLTEVDVIAIRHSSEGSNVLAKRYGVSRRTIDDARYGRSWVYLPNAKSAKEMSFHGKKFTPKDVFYIRTSDESSLILAAKYEVNKSSIDNIRSRRTWANI